MAFVHIQDKPILPELHAETTESGRIYVTPEGLHYPSVTTVLGSESKEGIEAWKKRVGEEEAAKVLVQAGVRGTQMHELAENYLNNKEDWSKGYMPVNLFTFNSIKPLLDKHLNNIYWQEAPLYSDKLKTAGRVDCIAEWDGVLSIVDFKTSRRVKKKEWINSYFCQTAFYAAALYERTGLIAKQGVIVMAIDDEEPKVFIEPTYKWLQEFIKVRNRYE